MTAVNCALDGCDKLRWRAQPVCRMHYERMTESGSYDLLRAPSATANARNCLWRSMKRRFPEGNAWQSFDEFSATVGPLPSYSHTLFKARPDELIGPNNFLWAVREGSHGRKRAFEYHTEEGRRQHDAFLKAKYPDRQKDTVLKKTYGISIEQYRDLIAAQNGCCAVCKKPETLIKKGKLLLLCVDHDHETNAVRGLLCNLCNRAIGLFCDEPDNLEAGAAYLRKHREQRSNVVALHKNGEKAWA